VKFGLVAGETSGDLLGAGLIRAIKERLPDARFEGVVGPAMLEAGCKKLADAESLAVMGLIEPLRHLPELLRLRSDLVKHWIESPPDVFVGIDAPDFNLGLERRLKDAGILTCHYVGPTVWAWRQGRIRTIARSVDRVLCILPFEKDFYDQHGVDAVFVGHPKADRVPAVIDTLAARRSLGIEANGPVVALLPGSRASEVTRLGPLFASAARMLADRDPAPEFVTPVAKPGLRPMYEAMLEAEGVAGKVRLFDGRSEEVLAAADVVLLASGTAALESALFQRPTVAAYKVSALTAWLVRHLGLLKIDYVTMPNHLTDEPLVSEFIQDDATPDKLAGAVAALLDDPGRRAAISKEFAKLRTRLALGADQCAAEAVLGLVDD
jgi:lipid-A-disaccharide synthase